MSLKSVELQIALPRVQDAARIQEYNHQRPQHDQQLASEQMKTQQELERKRTASANETEKTLIRERQGGNKRRGTLTEHPQAGHSKKDKKDKDGQEYLHPYKGHHIDISL